MTDSIELRRSAENYAEDYISGEDPNEEQEEVLRCDEVFCEVADALKSVEVQLRYGTDLSDLTRDKLRESKRQLEQALESRAESLLE